MKSYRLSRAGRRTTIILLISALIIWAFAFLTFRSTLGASPDPSVGFVAALRENLAKGLSISQIVPALLMLVLIVATPLVVWNVLEEWAAVYTVMDGGLRFDALGVHVLYPWSGIVAISSQDEDSDEPVDELLLNDDYTPQIRNPLLRFLHRQAYGRQRLPIYAGLEERDDLLAEVRARATLAERPGALATAE